MSEGFNAPRKGDQPWATIAGLLLAALCIAGADALHARHASYYLLLGWYAGSGIGSRLSAQSAVLVLALIVLGAIDIALLGDRFWAMTAVWLAIMIAGAIAGAYFDILPTSARRDA